MAQQSAILASIIRFSLRRGGVVLTLAAALFAYGLITLTRAKFDVFPELAPPEVTLRLEAPGLSPQQVEDLVTGPVERTLLGVEGVKTIRSHSLQGISAITLIFHQGTNIYRARQLVTERLASMSAPLPPGVAPFMSPLTSSAGTVLQVGLTSTSRSLMALRTSADWVVKSRLLAADGVAQVQVYGGELKQLQVQIRPQKLVQYNLSIPELLRVAKQATAVAGAGFVENRDQRIILHTEAQALTPEALAKTVVSQRNGADILLGDVATVTTAAAPPIGAASINGQPGVILLVTEQYGANTLDVTRRLEQAIKELRPTLEPEHIKVYGDLFRPANYILTALHNVRQAMAIGGGLVVIVLVLFLFNLRTAAISVAAIPLSLLTAVTVLTYLGFGLNIMVVGGLAVAIGEVVDDAIVDVENILRRLRENRHRVAVISRPGGTPPAAGAPRAEGPSEPACTGDEASGFEANCTPCLPRTGAPPGSRPTRCRPPGWLLYFARSKSSKSGGGRRDSIIARSVGILREKRAGLLLATPTRPRRR